ncbi:eukaryotic translation initiation factor 3 subunit G [Hordeum vulgare]|nr:eukaryotic translation initiation factor 3 subunit G [Hordeum vulgare]
MRGARGGRRGRPRLPAVAAGRHRARRERLQEYDEYRFDDGGNKVKVTTTTRVCKLAHARLSKAAVERRSWGKMQIFVKTLTGKTITLEFIESNSLTTPLQQQVKYKAKCEPMKRINKE